MPLSSINSLGHFINPSHSEAKENTDMNLDQRAVISKAMDEIVQTQKYMQRVKDASFFGGKVIVMTQNTAKLQDVESIVLKQHNSEMFTKYNDQVKKKGFIPSGDDFVLDPVDNGKCFGAVTHFFSRSIELGDYDDAAQEFDGGIPLQGLYYQNFFVTHAKPDVDKKVADLCYKMLDDPSLTRSKSFIKELKESTANLSDPQSILCIYDMINKFTKRGYDPFKINLVDAAKKYFARKKKPLEGSALATIRLISDVYTNRNQTRIDAVGLTLSVADLEIEEVIHTVAKPTAVLNSMTSSLDNGFYMLIIPLHDEISDSWEAHVVGFIIEDDGFYCLDPNFAIGKFDKAEINECATLIVSDYAEKDFSSPDVESDEEPSVLDNRTYCDLYKIGSTAVYTSEELLKDFHY